MPSSAISLNNPSLLVGYPSIACIANFLHFQLLVQQEKLLQIVYLLGARLYPFFGIIRAVSFRGRIHSRARVTPQVNLLRSTVSSNSTHLVGGRAKKLEFIEGGGGGPDGQQGQRFNHPISSHCHHFHTVSCRHERTQPFTVSS
ncbi:hypothetical protein BKA65DRAFT_43892 [Rhexocercosporidium sp. MPI-PUGE-AT-0058]|nr:hypothetical protein BKA65DRAFT_43892 [Rhexocercosporidium sp. MPI-PUGE-AT-0058]